MGLRTADQISKTLISRCRQLDEAVELLDMMTKRAPAAEYAYTNAHSDVFPQAEGKTIPEKEASVFPELKELWFEHIVSKQRLKYAAELCRSRRAQLSAAQTEATSLKAELDKVAGGVEDDDLG